MNIGKRGPLVTEYDPSIAVALQKHIDEGGSVNSFYGPGCITQYMWQKWLREIPELIAIKLKYNEEQKFRRGFVRAYLYKIGAV